MKKYNVIIFLLFSILNFSQKIEVEYVHNGGNLIYFLDLYDDYSVFIAQYSKTKNRFDTKLPDKFLVKNYHDNLIYSNFYHFTKQSLNLFDWKIRENTKEILGYKCTEATMEYRKHKYTAYFTTEIPIPDGPHIFNGLPGLILEIERNDYDEFHNFIAISLKINKLTEYKDFSYRKFMSNKFVPFDEIINKFNKRIINKFKFDNADKEIWSYATIDTIDDLYMESNEEVKRLAGEHNGFSVEKKAGIVDGNKEE